MRKGSGNRRSLASRYFGYGARETCEQLRDLLRCGRGIEISADGRCGCTCAAGFGLHMVEGTTRSQASGRGTSDAIDYPGQESRLSEHQRGSTVVSTRARSPAVDYACPFRSCDLVERWSNGKRAFHRSWSASLHAPRFFVLGAVRKVKFCSSFRLAWAFSRNYLFLSGTSDNRSHRSYVRLPDAKPVVPFLMRVTTAFSELCSFRDWENAPERLGRKQEHGGSQTPNGYNGNSGSGPFRFPTTSRFGLNHLLC